MGKWLACKWHQAVARHAEAQEEVLKSGSSPCFYMSSGKPRLSCKPSFYHVSASFGIYQFVLVFLFYITIGQSKNVGKKAVEDAIWLQNAVKALTDYISHLEELACDITTLQYLITVAREELKGAYQQLKEKKATLAYLERALGLEDSKIYGQQASSKFINLQMNARAKKLCLQERLRARKFECDCIQCSLH